MVDTTVTTRELDTAGLRARVQVAVNALPAPGENLADYVLACARHALGEHAIYRDTHKCAPEPIVPPAVARSTKRRPPQAPAPVAPTTKRARFDPLPAQDFTPRPAVLVAVQAHAPVTDAAPVPSAHAPRRVAFNLPHTPENLAISHAAMKRFMGSGVTIVVNGQPLDVVACDNAPIKGDALVRNSSSILHYSPTSECPLQIVGRASTRYSAIFSSLLDMEERIEKFRAMGVEVSARLYDLKGNRTQPSAMDHTLPRGTWLTGNPVSSAAESDDSDDSGSEADIQEPEHAVDDDVSDAEEEHANEQDEESDDHEEF